MHYLSIIASLLFLTLAACNEAQHPLSTLEGDHISIPLFAELEQFSRIVDISYCVGTTGISHPFSCASRCSDFPSFELVSTFNTGPLMSDSCGYIVLDHGNGKEGEKRRVIVAFRGTYSIANTIVDLSTVPQEYVPYPDNPDDGADLEGRKEKKRLWSSPWPWEWFKPLKPKKKGGKVAARSGTKEERRANATCTNCTVHSGFWSSWQDTRPHIIPHIEASLSKYPFYEVHLVGHSLGGAVAGLAALEFEGMGLHPTVTTFGEPRIGNKGLRDWIDKSFGLTGNREGSMEGRRYRRITHVDDPVPLLPLSEWGYRAHAGEVYIEKAALQPSISDVRLCDGDDDPSCIAAGDSSIAAVVAEMQDLRVNEEVIEERWGVPIEGRYKIWQLFFAHRDYFWRLGLCIPGGDPLDWGRGRYDFGNEKGDL